MVERIKVLVIDDNESSRHDLQTVLRFLGEETIAANYNDENLTISFNSRYLLDIASAIEDEKIIGISKGSKSYSDLVDFVGNSAISKPMEEILFNLEHWAMFHDTGERHISDKDMIEIIAAALNYNYTVEDSKNEDYGVTHSSKLYIIDQEGNMRVVWRGFDWTYASVYHDIELLL